MISANEAREIVMDYPNQYRESYLKEKLDLVDKKINEASFYGNTYCMVDLGEYAFCSQVESFKFNDELLEIVKSFGYDVSLKIDNFWNMKTGFSEKTVCLEVDWSHIQD